MVEDEVSASPIFTSLEPLIGGVVFGLAVTV